MNIIERHDEMDDVPPRKLSGKWFILVVVIATVSISILFGLILLVARLVARKRVR